MQRICEDTQICHAILRGKSNLHLFEEEIQKMKILDAAEKSKREQQTQVLAYCVLDNEVHLLVRTRVTGETESFLEQIRNRYQTALPEDSGTKGKSIFKKDSFNEVKNIESAAQCARKLHLLPVKCKVTERPEDYWWSSYTDYMGRKWIGLADTGELLHRYGQDARKAAASMRRDYQKYLIEKRARFR